MRSGFVFLQRYKKPAKTTNTMRGTPDQPVRFSAGRPEKRPVGPSYSEKIREKIKKFHFWKSVLIRYYSQLKTPIPLHSESFTRRLPTNRFSQTARRTPPTPPAGDQRHFFGIFPLSLSKSNALKRNDLPANGTPKTQKRKVVKFINRIINSIFHEKTLLLCICKPSGFGNRRV